MSHLCHATGCPVEVPPWHLMCLRHWRMVPILLQRAIWREYRPGQEVDKHPSAAYLAVMAQAIKLVAEKEDRKHALHENPALFDDEGR